MPTLLKSRCIADRSRVAARDHDRFLQRHRLLLLRYLDGRVSASAEELDALGFVECVLTEWYELFDGSGLPDPKPEERAFWFALYQLELLAESPGPYIDPYEKVLLEVLVEVREILRQEQPLPEYRFMATRPDGA